MRLRGEHVWAFKVQVTWSESCHHRTCVGLWLNFNVNIIDYDLIVLYHKVNHQKGGVAIYHHSLLENPVVSMDIKQFSWELICELAGMKFSFTFGKNLLNLGTYRLTDGSLENAITSMSSTLEVLPLNSNGICTCMRLQRNYLEESWEKSALN